MQEWSSDFKPRRPYTIRGSSDMVNIRQTISDKITFPKTQDLNFQVQKKSWRPGLNFVLVFTREVMVVCKVLLQEGGLKPAPLCSDT